MDSSALDTQDDDEEVSDGGVTSEHEDDEDLATMASIPMDDDAAFDTLVAEIKEVMAELAQDKAMDAVRGEYEKLFNALEKSHKNEKRLTTKCQELVSEIANQQVN